MSVYSKATEQDLFNLRKLAEQQKTQRALKIKNGILKPTHDIKLAESLSPITKKLDTINESTKQLGEVIEKSQPENIIPQPAIEHTPAPQPIENNEGLIYDVELENRISNMKKQKRFFNIQERNNGDITWNGFPVEKIGGKKLKIDEDVYNTSDDLQSVFTITSNIPLKKSNDEDMEKYKNVLKNLGFKIYKAIRGDTKPARYKYSKKN